MDNVLAAGWFRREGKLAAVQLVHTSDGSPGWRHINESTSTPSASQHHTNNFSVKNEQVRENPEIYLTWYYTLVLNGC